METALGFALYLKDAYDKFGLGGGLWSKMGTNYARLAALQSKLGQKEEARANIQAANHILRISRGREIDLIH